MYRTWDSGKHSYIHNLEDAGESEKQILVTGE